MRSCIVRKCRLAFTIIAVAILGIPVSISQVASAQQFQRGFNPAVGAPSGNGPFVNPALLPQTNPWTTPPKRPNVADRAEAVLAKNPLAAAWASMKGRQQIKQTQAQAANLQLANRPQRDVISLQQPTGPPTPELFVSAAALSEQRGQIEQARDQFTRALTIAPDHVGARLGAARMEDRLGNLRQAEELYRQVVALSPGNPTSLNDLALCLARQERYEESAHLLGQAVQINTQKPLYRNNLAKVLVQLRRDNEALAHLIAAHGPAIGNLNLGHLLSMSGRANEATGYFATAAKIDPNLAQAITVAGVQASHPTHPQVARNPQAAPARPLPPVGPQMPR